MSTRMISGPIWQISLNGITIFGSQFRKLSTLLLPGTMILQIHPLQESNSRSHTLPSFLQFLTLMTSLHFSSEKSIVHPGIRFLTVYAAAIPVRTKYRLSKRNNFFRRVHTTTIQYRRAAQKRGRTWHREKLKSAE